MVGVSASVNLPLHHKVQKFSSGTGSPGWSRKKGRKTVVVVVDGYWKTETEPSDGFPQTPNFSPATGLTPETQMNFYITHHLQIYNS